jgi:hypothetical protein
MDSWRKLTNVLSPSLNKASRDRYASPVIRTPAGCTAGVHSTKELSRQLISLFILSDYFALYNIYCLKKGKTKNRKGIQAKANEG